MANAARPAPNQTLEFSFTEKEFDVLATALENYWSTCHEAEHEEDNVQEHSSAEVHALLNKLNSDRRRK